MEVSSALNGYLTVGDTITGTGLTTTTVSSIAGAGNVTGAYGINGTAQAVASTTITATGNTIHVPTGTTAPAAGTLLAVESGTGAFQSGSYVNSSPGATSFTVVNCDPTNSTTCPSPAARVPSTRLVAAKICGGACAFFDHTQDPQDNSKQTFSLTYTSSVKAAQWGAGFVCLSGIDTMPTPITSVKVTGKTWSETVN
jgi:hypothetical protein